MTPRIGMAGAGRAAAALACAWQQHGLSLTGLWNRTPQRSHRLAQQASARPFDTLDALVEACDVVVLAVADDAIERLAAACAPLAAGRVFLHLSGARDLSALGRLREAGARVGSLHPVAALAGDSAASALVGAAYAVEYEDALTHDIIVSLIEPLQGLVLHIPPGQKARYHAALCLLNNYTVTLYDVSARLLGGMGLEEDVVRHALLSLLGSTFANLARLGVPDALTGPLVRADIGTITGHLAALEGDAVLALYRALGRATLPMVQARGTDTAALRTLLEEDNC